MVLIDIMMKNARRCYDEGDCGGGSGDGGESCLCGFPFETKTMGRTKSFSGKEFFAQRSTLFPHPESQVCV